MSEPTSLCTSVGDMTDADLDTMRSEVLREVVRRARSKGNDDPSMRYDRHSSAHAKNGE